MKEKNFDVNTLKSNDGKEMQEASARRLTEDFVELVKIDNESCHEREMADRLKEKLKGLGFENIYEDNTGEKIGGNAGNVVGVLKGNKKDAPGVLLVAHMDSVVPANGKNPIVDGDTIRTDGKTVLGGDDLAGCVSILEAVRMLKESNVPHGDIYVAYTVSEELGLLGAKNLDISKIDAQYSFVMDNDVRVAVGGSSEDKFEGKFIGKAAHAAVEPEKGINSLLMFSKAMVELSQKGLLGKIDNETCANVILKEGGVASNIVPELTKFEGEVRSLNEEKLQKTTKQIKEIFNRIAKEMGGEVELKFESAYKAFKVERDHPIVKIIERAAKKADFPLVLEETLGGCDAHEINQKGMPALLMPVGVRGEHTKNEHIKIPDLKNSTNFLYQSIVEVGKEKKKNLEVKNETNKKPSLSLSM